MHQWRAALGLVAAGRGRDSRAHGNRSSSALHFTDSPTPTGDADTRFPSFSNPQHLFLFQHFQFVRSFPTLPAHPRLRSALPLSSGSPGSNAGVAPRSPPSGRSAATAPVSARPPLPPTPSPVALGVARLTARAVVSPPFSGVYP